MLRPVLKQKEGRLKYNILKEIRVLLSHWFSIYYREMVCGKENRKTNKMTNQHHSVATQHNSIDYRFWALLNLFERDGEPWSQMKWKRRHQSHSAFYRYKLNFRLYDCWMMMKSAVCTFISVFVHKHRRVFIVSS